MTRRQFLIVPIVGASLSTVLAQPNVVYATKEETDFVLAFNNWARTGNRNGMTVDIKEIKAWQTTEKAWNTLRHIVRQSYK